MDAQKQVLDALYQKTHIVTGKVRLSYCHLFEKYVNPQLKGAEPSWSTMILVPKSDIITKQKIDAAQEAAKEIGKLKKWGGIIPPVLSTVVYDGDTLTPSGKQRGLECKGHWVFAASNKKQQPVIVDLNLNPILDQSEVYSGMYARVSVDFYPYQNLKVGIGCSLDRIQKLEDGTPLGGSRSSLEDDFGAPSNPYGI